MRIEVFVLSCVRGVCRLARRIGFAGALAHLDPFGLEPRQRCWLVSGIGDFGDHDVGSHLLCSGV